MTREDAPHVRHNRLHRRRDRPADSVRHRPEVTPAMCTRNTAGGGIAATAVQLASALSLRHLLIAPALIAFAVGFWIAPVTVGVTTGVFTLSCGMAYMLGAYRERPVGIHGAQTQPEHATIVELQRRTADAEAVAAARQRELDAARQQTQTPATAPYRVIPGVPASRELDA